MRNDYVALRVAEAKIQRYELAQEQLQAAQKEQHISYCVHTDFNALRDTSESEEEKLRSFR